MFNSLKSFDEIEFEVDTSNTNDGLPLAKTFLCFSPLDAVAFN